MKVIPETHHAHLIRYTGKIQVTITHTYVTQVNVFVRII